MAPNQKKNKKRTVTKFGGIISDKVGDYANDPYFVKKAEEAREFLKIAGLPKEFKNISLD